MQHVVRALMISEPIKLEPCRILATIIEDHINHVKYNILLIDNFVQSLVLCGNLD